MLPEVAQLPEVRMVLTDVDSIEKRLAHYTVTTVEGFNAGAHELAVVKALQKKLEATRTSITGPINQGLKAILDLFRGPGDRLAQVERKIKAELAAFDARQREQARIEQAAADERARKERERLEAQAAKAEASGKTEKAEALQERAAQVVAPVISRDTPKVATLASRKVWRFEITDPMQVPREYLAVDESKVRQVVKALGAEARIPGVRVWSEDTYASRSVDL